ncbi:MAG TPA: cyclopropane-fatty-acyl-phospholipid synthase family protein, partial [Hyphomicrobiaceae bacterium]|nr:cyclopropane-fatty-acyl-phospholipid synthase family protein [Hyphomicrobiaceae bacterium]
MYLPLRAILTRIVRAGHLVVVSGDGTTEEFGDRSGTLLRVRIADQASERAIAFDPSLALGEAYIDGRFVMEQGSIYDFIALVMQGLAERPLPYWTRSLDALRFGARRVLQFNPVFRARRNARHHYDIETSIYDLFLDADKQYSCAYFTPGADLDAAQLAKKRHIAAKLALAPGQRVLDIGSGWGGLGLYIARHAGADVTGVTLSAEQLAVARSRAEREMLGERARFELEDYRRVRGRFDRIVSVGMFEHVGVNHFKRYFRKVRDLLADDGVALIHSIGRTDGPGYTNPFIAKYIFPGGYYPALSEVLPAVEKAGLIVSDIEILRLHYAETLRAWRQRFMANRARAAEIKGEPFCRMWEFYLAGAEAAFRYQNLIVFQLQLIKRIDALPITRDYMQAAERRLAMRDSSGGDAARMAG